MYSNVPWLPAQTLNALACAAIIGSSGCGESGVSGAGGATSPSSTTEVAAGSATSDGKDFEHEAWMTSTARQAESADGTYIVRWEPIGGLLPDAEPFSIAIEVKRKDGRALAHDVRVLADAEMPHHGHGMSLVPTIRNGPRVGAFVADGLLLHMSGRWTFAIDVEEDGILERAQWVLDVE
jgi:hypothetical protein